MIHHGGGIPAHGAGADLMMIGDHGAAHIVGQLPVGLLVLARIDFASAPGLQGGLGGDLAHLPDRRDQHIDVMLGGQDVGIQQQAIVHAGAGQA